MDFNFANDGWGNLGVDEPEIDLDFADDDGWGNLVFEDPDDITFGLKKRM